MGLPNVTDIERELLYRKYEEISFAEKFLYGKTRISVIPKLKYLFEKDEEGFEYELLEGGRGSGKSETIGQLLVLIAREEKTRILCTREIQLSIKDSVKKLIEEWVDRMGFREEFHITQDTIYHKRTGTDFIFMGLKAGTDSDSMKSLKGAKYCWIEEAQTLSEESWKKLDPTIRIDGRKFFFSFNPSSEKDTVNEIKLKKKARCTRINYNENPFLPKVLLDQALELKETNYDSYCHVWEGVPMAEDASSIVLQYSLLSKCVDLHKSFGFGDGLAFAGFDIADGVTDIHDKNSFASRTGCLTNFVDEWRIGQIYESVAKVHQNYYTFGFTEINFDATGMGAGAKSEFARVEAEENKKLPYDVIPFQGGSSPRGADTCYIKHGMNIITNGHFFKNLKAQSWWNLRLRLENSVKLLQGKKIDRDGYYLSFSSDIKDLTGLFSELSQATYKIDSGGRIQIDKCPGTKTIKVDGKNKEKRSPNRADAVVYSYANDFKYGLRAFGEEKIQSYTYTPPRSAWA